MPHTNPIISLRTPIYTPIFARILHSIIPSSKRFSCKRWQNKCRLVNLFAIVLAQLFFLLLAPCPNRLFDITRGVLATDHKANLARRVGRNGRICILGDGEDFFACLFQLRDEAQVEPLVLSCSRMKKSVRRLYDAHRAVTSLHPAGGRDVNELLGWHQGEGGAYNLAW